MIVSNRKGPIARIARRLHKRWNRSWLFKIGYIPFVVSESPRPIGIAVHHAYKGEPVIIRKGAIEIANGTFDDKEYMISSKDNDDGYTSTVNISGTEWTIPDDTTFS